MIAIETQLVPNEDGDDKCARQSNGETGHINEGEHFMPNDVAPCKGEIDPKHRKLLGLKAYTKFRPRLLSRQIERIQTTTHKAVFTFDRSCT